MEKAQIDENLRRIFDDRADEDLPDDLQSLIDRLDDLDFPNGSDVEANENE